MATNPLLKQGSRGDSVKQLQTFLNGAGYNVGASDGIFGTNTLAGVTKYQKANGLATDGIVGNNTWGSIYGTKTPTPTTAPKPTGVTTPTPVKTASNTPSGMLKFNPLTGDQIKTQANDSINPLYNAETEAFTQATDRNRLALQQQTDARNQLYGQQKEESETFYGQDRQRVSDQDLSRGLARSSIATNGQKRVTATEAGNLSKMQQGLQSDLGAIQSQLVQLEGQLSDSLKRLDIDKAAKIKTEIDRLNTEQENKQMEITQFNNSYQSDQNSQKLQQDQFGLQKSQFAFDQKTQQDQLAFQKSTDQRDYDWKTYMDNQNLSLAKSAAARSAAASATAAARSAATRSSSALKNADPYTLAYDDVFNSSNPYQTFKSKESQYRSLLSQSEFEYLKAQAEAQGAKSAANSGTYKSPTANTAAARSGNAAAIKSAAARSAAARKAGGW